jgi:hypothetical protein
VTPSVITQPTEATQAAGVVFGSCESISAAYPPPISMSGRAWANSGAGLSQTASNQKPIAMSLRRVIEPHQALMRLRLANEEIDVAASLSW